MSSTEKRENEFSAKLHDAQSTPFLRVLGEKEEDRYRKSECSRGNNLGIRTTRSSIWLSLRHALLHRLTNTATVP